MAPKIVSGEQKMRKRNLSARLLEEPDHLEKQR
jgi:hypothetical protein